MPELAARADALAVQVDARLGEPREHVGQRVGEGVEARAEHVRHDGPGRAGGGVAERQVEHRAQVLLELARHRAVDGPVAGVVGAHRQLVDPHRGGAVRLPRLEQLDGEDPRDAEPLRHRDGDAARLGVHGRVEVGRGRDDLRADAVALDGLDDGPGPDLAGRATGDQRRELAHERHLALHEQRRGTVGRGLQPVRDVVGRRHDAHALAVVAAAGRLHDGFVPDLLREEVGQRVARLRRVRRQRGPARAGQPERGEPAPHDDLVLGLHQRVRAGTHRRAVVDEVLQQRVRHVLVLEREHRGRDATVVGGDERADRRVVARHADRRVRDHLRGRRRRVLDQHPQAHPQLGGGGGHHAGELTPSDDGDDRGCGGGAGGG